MRLGRIMIAGLAPLFSLSAIAATLVAPPDSQAATHSRAADPLPQLLASVLPYLAAAERAAPATPLAGYAAQDLLDFEALNTAPLGRSLWLLASLIAIPWSARKHLRSTLRC